MVRVFKLELLGWLWEVHGVRHSKINPILWFNVDLVRGNWHWKDTYICIYRSTISRIQLYNYPYNYSMHVVCMYIIYIHTYLYTHIYIYSYVKYTHIYHIYIYIFTCMCVPMCVYIYLWCFLTLEYIPQVMVFNTKSWSSMTWMRGASHQR